MRSEKERLNDLQEAIERIEKQAAHGRDAFDRDELIQVWILHHLQIIGEASRTLPDSFRQRHPDVPWSKIIGMRNILVHNYFGLDLEAVWSAVVQDLPFLKQAVEAMLRQ